MNASRTRKPRHDQDVSKTFVIKTEQVSGSETENNEAKGQFSDFPPQDETSRDKSKDECQAEVDDFFSADVLINYPHGNKLWNESSTRLFLNMYKELKVMYEKGESNLKHRPRFVVIAENLRKCGFDYTAVQVENRFKSLKRSYQKKVLQDEVLTKQGKTKPSHPSSQYHLYADDMHEIFRDCVGEMREAVPNLNTPEFLISDKDIGGKAKKRKLVEISTEDHLQIDGEISESRSEGFHNVLPSFVQQLRNKIPETVTCTTDNDGFPELQDPEAPFQFPTQKDAYIGDAAEVLQLLRDDYNTWQKIREEGKNRRHQEKMKMYSQLIQVMTNRN